MSRTSLAYFGSLLSLAIFIIARQTLVGRPAFRAEFVVEDFVLLLILALGFVPPSVRSFAGRVVSCLMGAIMVAIVWTTGMRSFTLPKAIIFTIVFTLLGIYSAVMAGKEFSKLRKSMTERAGLNGLKGTDRIDALANPENERHKPQ